LKPFDLYEAARPKQALVDFALSRERWIELSKNAAPGIESP
jgi:hypothetical protein